MAVFSGTWTLTVVEKVAVSDQRIVITGSTNADGFHRVVAGSTIPDVHGMGFQMKIQALLVSEILGEVVEAWIDTSEKDVMSYHPAKGIIITIFTDMQSGKKSAPILDFGLVVECTSTDPPLAASPFADSGLGIPEKYVRQPPPTPESPFKKQRPDPPIQKIP